MRRYEKRSHKSPEYDFLMRIWGLLFSFFMLQWWDFIMGKIEATAGKYYNFDSVYDAFGGFSVPPDKDFSTRVTEQIATPEELKLRVAHKLKEFYIRHVLDGVVLSEYTLPLTTETNRHYDLLKNISKNKDTEINFEGLLNAFDYDFLQEIEHSLNNIEALIEKDLNTFWELVFELKKFSSDDMPLKEKIKNGKAVPDECMDFYAHAVHKEVNTVMNHVNNFPAIILGILKINTLDIKTDPFAKNPTLINSKIEKMLQMTMSLDLYKSKAKIPGLFVGLLLNHPENISSQIFILKKHP